LFEDFKHEELALRIRAGIKGISRSINNKKHEIGAEQAG